MRSTSPHDLKAVEAFSENVSDWARYQNLAGECDTVEKAHVPVGTYDWRTYIQEETELARRRERESKPAKKAERAEPGPVPHGYYA